mgnify:CR=1 FL=1
MHYSYLETKGTSMYIVLKLIEVEKDQHARAFNTEQ